MSKDLNSTNGKNGATLWIDEDGFITDGKYKCPIKKGRYTIKIFRNPSGELRPSLHGYRPKRYAGQTEQDEGDNGSGNAPDSRRVRRNDFDSLKEADAARDTLVLQDSNSTDHTRLARTSLTDEELRDAGAAREIILQLRARDVNGTKWTFKRTAEFTKEHFKPCENRKLLDEAVKAFITMKDQEAQRAHATLDGIKSTLNRLLAACHGKCVHEVSPETIMPLIHRGECVKTMKRYKSVYVNFFKWCAESPRKWTPNNPAKEIPLPDREDDEYVPEILSNPDVVALLREALQFKGGRLSLFCVCAIACALRPAEMGRIQALRKILGTLSFHFGERPDENYISVIGKKRKRRPVIIPPEFVPFIRVFVEAGYPIIPRNFSQDWTHLRALIGYCGSKLLLPSGIEADKLVDWTPDFPRHTGGTHHLYRYENEYKTALWMGNSPKMIFVHYRGKSTKMQTEEFYQIPSKLPLPTLAELTSAGIPEGATDAELKKLKCPVDRHTTFVMKKSDFEAARAAHLKAHPEAAIPERKGPTRKTGLWTKRRMLDLPKGEELWKLFWTIPIKKLAKKFGVACGTMALIAKDHNIVLPEKGHWQKRAAGHPVTIPDEVAKLFPDGLPTHTGAVGHRPRIKYPTLAEFFNLLWHHSLTELAAMLQCSTCSLERKIQELGLSAPGHSYWHSKPERRTIPERIQHLLTLTSEQLRHELETESPEPQPDADSHNAA